MATFAFSEYPRSQGRPYDGSPEKFGQPFNIHTCDHDHQPRWRGSLRNSLLTTLIASLGLFIVFWAPSAHSQMAQDGLPWKFARVDNQFFIHSCGPTIDATACANEELAYACAVNTSVNPRPPVPWCNSSVASCQVSTAECAVSGGGTIQVATDQPNYFVTADADAVADCNSCSRHNNNFNFVADPINPANGNVSHQEADIPASDGAESVTFARFYNSIDDGNTDLGIGWRHSFSRRIVPVVLPTLYQRFYNNNPRSSGGYTTPADACNFGWSAIKSKSTLWANTTSSYTAGATAGGTCSLSQNGLVVATLRVYSAVPIPLLTEDTAEGFTAIRDDGQQVNFTLVGSSIVGPTGITLRLTQTGTGYQLIDDDDNTEVYDANGALLSITNRTGIVRTLTYDANNRLSSVTDSFGHSLTLGYDAQNRLTSLTVPSSIAVQYGYDSQSRLSTITYLDGTTRSYVYENSTFITSLTGVIDESATRFSTWGYNSANQGTSTQEAGGADAETLVYNTNGSVTTTDALGAVRNFSFHVIGDQNRVTGISGSKCPTCDESASTTYDSGGFVVSRTDYDGNLTCYANTTDNRGLEFVRVEGFAPGSTCPSDLPNYAPAVGTRQRQIATAWDSNFRLPDSIFEPNRTTAFTYDSSGNALTKTITDRSVTPNITRTSTYTYDSYGRLLTADGPRTDVSDVTTYTYYTCTTGFQCGQLQTVTNAAGQVTTYNTYNAYGQPLTITDPNGILTTLTYDARQRLTSRQTASETTAFDYWPTGLLKKVTLPDGSYLAYTYDSAHRLTQITDSLGNKIVYTLDAMGNRTAEKSYDSSNALHRTHTRVFNTLSQLFKDVNAAGTAAVTTTFGYDNNGNQTSIGAPLSRNTANAYDELNRLSQITDPANGITQFGYDANDNLTSLTDPRGLATAYSYTGFGDLKTQTSPDTGATTNTYDSGGNLATSTDARGAVSTYAYDALNRVTSVAYSLSGTTDQTLTFTYDTGTNGKGHLTGASDASHSVTWGYDPLGRVASKSQTVGSVTQSVGYGYTNADLTTLTTPSGQTVAYGYNGNHQVTSVTVNGTTVLNSVTYEPLGPVNSWTWGNGTTTTRTYDTDGKISQIISAGTKAYGYDNAFRITGITDTSPGATNWTYGYDLLDRITSGTSPSTTRGWTYDANGNRQTETGTAASAYTIASSSNRISGITGALARTYGYDAAGNTTGYSTVTATYNNAGRLKTLSNGSTAETSIYNALGQRIEVSGGAVGTVLYAHDEAGHLLGEYDGTGALIEETVWLGDTPVATLRPNGSAISIYYVHSDQLNTPRQVTRPSDNMAMWTWNSDPFGTDAANANPAGTGTFAYNLRFPGQVFDGQAGLHQNGFRDFDPAVGRYVKSDPIGLNGGINTYTYVGGNPVTLVDPLGTKPGDSFPSVNAAAIDALNYINTKSDHCKREYGGWVYKEWSLFGNPTYSYDEPTGVGPAGGHLPSKPTFHGVYGMFHNHPPLPGHDSDNYSQTDEDTADWNNIPSYLEIPSGLIKRYTPEPDKPFPFGGRTDSVATGSCSCKSN